MERSTLQSMEFLFEQFKNHTTKGSRDYPAYTYAFGIYLSIFAASKIVNCLPVFLDGLILTVQKVGEFSDAVVNTAPRFLAGFTTFFELIKAIIFYIFWYFATPICQFLRNIGTGLYWLCMYVWWGIQYVKNGFKWPKEETESIPMLKSEPDLTSRIPPNAARDSRNCYGVGICNT